MHVKRTTTVILVILLLFLSFVPRVIEVLNRNFIFLLDQGRDYMAVKNIVVNGKLTLIGAEIGGGMAGFQGIFHGPFYFYFLAIPFILFKGDPYGGLLLMFIFGLLTIGMSYKVGRKIFNSSFGGLTMALLVAISPPLIAQSRFIWSPHPGSFFIVVMLYVVHLLYKKKKKHFFLAGFVSAFLYNFEFAIMVPVCIALLLYSFLILKFKYLKHYLFLTSGFMLGFLPMVLFEFRHRFGGIRGFTQYLLFQDKQESFVIHGYFDVFLHNFFDTFPKLSFLPPILIIILFIASAIFFLIREKDMRLKYFFLFLVLLTIITFFVLSFLRNYIFPYYLIHLNFVYIFFLSYILFSAFRNRIRNILVVFLGLFVSFIIVATLNAGYTFKKDLKDYGGMAKIKGKLEALDYIYNDAKGQRFGLLVFSPPVYTYPYDYLIWWHSRKQFGYIPHQEKRGPFYLLIEKDLREPWTYKGWLETVIKTGEVIYTKELPSGFIIQKRIEKRHEVF